MTGSPYQHAFSGRSGSILRALLCAPGTVVPYSALIAATGGLGLRPDVALNRVHQAVYRLRLSNRGVRDVIVTVRGEGYLLALGGRA